MAKIKLTPVPLLNKEEALRRIEINKDAKILILSVKQPWFKYMITGEKTIEVRRPSDWIRSRLIDKEGEPRRYDYIKIINGYGDHRPYFIAEYEGYGTQYNNTYTMSGGEKLEVKPEHFVLFLGPIKLKANYRK